MDSQKEQVVLVLIQIQEDEHPYVKEVCKNLDSAKNLLQKLGFIFYDGRYWREKDGAFAWYHERTVEEH